MPYFVQAIAAFAVLLIFVATMRIRAERARVTADELPGAVNDGPDVTLGFETTPHTRGACRFCERTAEYRTPVIRHARPWGDLFLRRIGVVPQVKFQLAIPKDLGAEVDLCDLHHHRAVSLLGAEIAAASADMAKFCDSQVRHLIEFQATGLEAKIAADASERRKRKPLATVTTMPPQKTNGAHA